MKKLAIFLSIIFLVVLAAIAQAANTVTRSDNVITISDIDSDWIWTTTFPQYTSGIRVMLIRFNPGAANDVLVIKSGTDTGAQLVNLLATDAEARVQYFFGANIRPMLDFSACVLTAGAKVTFVLNE